jgi:tetratricopeptide (TPR) repeat protein
MKTSPARSIVIAVPDDLARCLRVLFCAVVLAAAVIALYGRVLGYEFINLDDDVYVYANDHVKAGLTFDGFRWAWADVSTGNWHPLTWLSHMLDVQLFGVSAGSHHFMNVLWHAANSAVLMAALWFMTGCVWRSAFVAALFALHPLRVESVAWVAERKDVLSSFFYLSAMWAYAWYTKRPHGWARYMAVLTLFALGLMAKASVVTAPFLFLLLDYWPLRRKEPLAILVREKTPFFALAAAVSVVTYLGQKQAGAMRSIENVAVAERIANALASYVRYLGKIFWPHPLAVVYPFRADLPVLNVLASGILLAVITVLVVLRGRPMPYLAVGWFWFLGTMVPMIGFVQVGWQAYADRYTYLPCIGIFIALVWMAADLIELQKWRRNVAVGVAVTLLPVLALATWSQLPYWHDDLTLFQHAMDTTSDNPLAQYHVGDDLVELGRNREAIPHLEEMIRLRPKFYAGYFTLAKAQAAEGQMDLAAQNFSEALQFRPAYPEAYYSRALTLLKSGDAASAERDFRAALKFGLGVEYAADAHNALGVILAQRGESREATAEFEEAVQLQPSSVMAQANLATALLRQGRLPEAIARLKQGYSATRDPQLKKMLDDVLASQQAR